MEHQCDVETCRANYQDFTYRIRSRKWTEINAHNLLFMCEWDRNGNKLHNKMYQWSFCYEIFNRLRANYLLHSLTVNRLLDD